MTTLQKFLLDWYDKNKRSLPWRTKQPHPYKVWISEVMLQQTQVETVLPYYRRFLKFFPTVEALAAVPIEEVLKLWSGLGYYSRARYLHQAAKIVVEERGVLFPKTKTEWLKLPGIGEYSAGAIASIAFNERVPVVDGNVIRVLTRLFALRGDPKKNPLKKKLWEIATRLLHEYSMGVVRGRAGSPPDFSERRVYPARANRPGDFNQALMELGALVCLPREPRCSACPLHSRCKASLQNKMEEFPTPQKKKETQKILLEASLIRKNGFFLLAKRNGARHLQSMWEFPQIKPSDFGIQAKNEGHLAPLRHSIMNRSIRLTPYLYRFGRGRPKANDKYVVYRWIKLEALNDFPTSSLNKKIVKNILSVKNQVPLTPRK